MTKTKMNVDDMDNFNKVIQGEYSSTPNIWVDEEKTSKFEWFCLGLVAVVAAATLYGCSKQADEAKNRQYSAFKNIIRHNVDSVHRYQAKYLITDIIEKNKEGIKKIISQGFDVNSNLSNGTTPLMCAAAFGDIEMVDMFLQYNAKLLRQDNNGRTALDYAISAGNKKVVKFLNKKIKEEARLNSQKMTMHGQWCLKRGMLQEKQNQREF